MNFNIDGNIMNIISDSIQINEAGGGVSSKGNKSTNSPCPTPPQQNKRGQVF